LAWQERKARRFLLIGLGSYVIMRVWSGLFFIPEMLAFQKVPLDAPASWSSPRESHGGRFGRGSENHSTRWRSFLLALFWLERPKDVIRHEDAA
jgi:hypothetical protein